MKPEISVVISTYNSERFIENTIGSVLNQTFQDFEIIIVDDASTDNTQQVIEKLQDKDERIRYIKHEENFGAPSKTKNTGIKHARGEYIAFLDHDDEWLPQKLEKQLELFEKGGKNLGLVSCNVLDVYERGEIVKHRIGRYNVSDNPFLQILDRCFIHSSSSVMVRKKVLDDVGGFDENLKISDDWELWIRILKKYDFNFAPEFLLKYRLHGDNLSRESSSQKAGDLEYILDKHKSVYEKHKKQYVEMLRYTGNLHLLNGEMGQGRSLLQKSININNSVKSYLNLFLSFFGVRFYRMIVSVKRKLSN